MFISHIISFYLFYFFILILVKIFLNIAFSQNIKKKKENVTN